jgi:hypothetical protein
MLPVGEKVPVTGLYKSALVDPTPPTPARRTWPFCRSVAVEPSAVWSCFRRRPGSGSLGESRGGGCKRDQEHPGCDANESEPLQRTQHAALLLGSSRATAHGWNASTQQTPFASGFFPTATSTHGRLLELIELRQSERSMIEDGMAAIVFRKGDKVVRVAGVDDSIGTVVGTHEQRVDLLAPLGAIRSYDVAWHRESRRVLEEHEATIRLATDEELNAGKRLDG